MPEIESVAQLASPSDLLPEIERAKREVWSPVQLLEWGLDRFAPRIALSASFGAPEGLVVLDMMHRIDPRRTRVFTIDTGRLPQQTYDLIDRVRERYSSRWRFTFPGPTVCRRWSGSRG